MTATLRASGVEIAAAVRAGRVTSRAVVDAHIELLKRVNPSINAVVVPRYEQARAEADAADARVAAAGEGDELPPLLGVPCTIKESIAVEGMPNCAGLLARREIRAETTAPVAQRLIDAGAIVLGLTNTSEVCLWIESDNRVYGRTRNAYDQDRIAGGSSGGEGAAIGAGGSPLGLGSDVGGSIRGPAFFNGVFGHKPSLGLVPITGAWPPAHGEVTRMVVNGPLARRAEDLMPLLRILAGPDRIDPVTREMELGDPATVSLDGLRVLISDHGLSRPLARDLAAAREQAAGALAAAGATIERVSLRSMQKAYEPYLAALADDEIGLHALLTGEGADPVTPRGLVARGGPHTTPTRMLLAAEWAFANRFPRRARKMIAWGRAFAEEIQATIGDGVLLHPPYPSVAPRHGGTVGRVWWVQPMAVLNLAAVPVTQVPLGLNGDGLPLGVQVAAGPGRDHVSIAVALELERVFGGWVPPGSRRAPLGRVVGQLRRRLGMGVLSGSSSAEIDAPLDAVWKVVEDVEKAPDWQGGMDDIEALERDDEGRPTLVEIEVDAKVRAIKSEVRFSYDGPTRLSWKQEKGDLKSLDGSWELKDLGDGRTHATYALEGDTGRMLGMLVRGPVEGKMMDLLVNARADELKAYVEGGS